MDPQLVDSSFWLRVAASIFCGFVIGLERQVRGKPVGIRTSILICMGTMLFIYLAMNINGGVETPRVLGQVVTGVGFLGAGVIMTKEGLVSGVTSASVVWLLAGIGAAIGLESYGVAIVICLVATSVLIGVELLETIYKVLRRGVHRHKQED